MYIYRSYSDISLETAGSFPEGLFIIIGGPIGAGLAYLFAYIILKRVGKYTKEELNDLFDKLGKS